MIVFLCNYGCIRQFSYLLLLVSRVSDSCMKMKGVYQLLEKNLSLNRGSKTEQKEVWKIFVAAKLAELFELALSQLRSSFRKTRD